MNNRKNHKRSIIIYMCLISVVAIALGMSDNIYANYFKEVYDVTAQQRAFIEFPRELPGVICILIIIGLSFLGDFRIALLAQILACVGIMVLGIFTPSFTGMMVFLFINSLGMHIFMPLQDSIGMSLAEPDKIGEQMGKFGSLKALMSFISGVIVFFGFRIGFFTFDSPIKVVFVMAGVCYILAIILCVMLIKEVNKSKVGKEKPLRQKVVFRYEYRYYYLLTVFHGVQKQIAYVFGSWVIIELLLKGADVMTFLTTAGSFMGVFFIRKVGNWLDKFGIKVMMYVDAISFIIVYVLFGFVVWGIEAGALAISGFSIGIIYVLYLLDKLSMQLGVVKSVYLKSIAMAPSDVTPALSTGLSLDHIVSIIAAQVSGYIWVTYGAHCVFFMTAFISLGNLFVASRIQCADKFLKK